MSIDTFPPEHAGLGSAAFTSYEEGSFTVTATGFTTAVTGTARYVRVGKQVTLHLPVLTGTSNATTFNLTGIPTSLGAVQNLNIPVLAQDNAVYFHGQVNYNSGTLLWVVARTDPFAVWTASGTKTLNPAVLTYMLL